MARVSSKVIAFAGAAAIILALWISFSIKRGDALAWFEPWSLATTLLVALFMGSWGYIALAFRPNPEAARGRGAFGLVAALYFLAAAGATAHVTSLTSSTVGLAFIALPIYAGAVMIPVIVGASWWSNRDTEEEGRPS